MNATITTLSIITLCLTFAATGCSNGVALGPPSEQDLASSPTAPSTVPTTTPTTPTTPASPTPPVSTPTAQKVAYSPDLQPIFNADCTSCHGSNRPAGSYSMTTYSGVMRAVRVGSASSALVIVTRTGGSMNRFFSGDRAAKAAMVNQWVVTDGAPASR
jgi:mono/diheme cytochrome c family protein